MKHTQSRILPLALLGVYCALVLCYTVLLRPAGFYTAHAALFWSYRAWFAGDRWAGVQILANIALFVPFGLLLSLCARKSAVWKALLAGLLLSGLIEGLQILLLRGQFELDDLVNNTLGAALGALGFALLQGRCSEKTRRTLVLALGAAAVLLAVCVCAFDNRETAEDAARNFVIQVESVTVEAGRVELSGFGFRVGREARGARLILASTKTGQRIPLRVEYGLERGDVGAYFGGGSAYTHSGFTARGEGLNAGEEYALYAAFGWLTPLATGVYLRDGALYCVSEAIYRAPENAGADLEALLREGSLRAYLPGLPCWIVQRGAALYWIVREAYPFFEADGTTPIQYGLWSTREDRLPPETLHRELGCADLHGNFEKFELSGDFGPYRVMARALPEDFPVTAVLTGYWTKTEGWVWRCCFRPVYTLR